jgi:pyruvate dehydrogenase E2 component (dihydrolipoamide acetyltransferase)
MAYEIVMPQLGLTMTEGSVNTWMKNPGERVQKGEMLFSVSTDKVDMEVESTASGFLNAMIEPGKTVPVGTVIAVLTDQPNEKISLKTHAAENGQPLSQAAATASPAESETRGGNRSYPASPRARSLAKTLSIDIAEVVPESGGRIVEADVKRYAEARKPAPKPEAISAVRKITAERTTQSFERAPHFYLGRELNVGRLVRLRQELQETAERKLGFRLTYTDFLLRALALALIEETEVNAYWQNNTIIRRESVDIAFAAQTGKGLLTPVIRNAGTLDLLRTALQRKQLSERAQQGTLQISDLEGGSATLSNLGTQGVDWFQAILNPPQSVILACGGIAKRPMVTDGQLEIADTLILTLSADHRVIDGVAAAKFLGVIARTLENPLELLV